MTDVQILSHLKTEASDARSANLSELAPLEFARLMNDFNREAVSAVESALPKIARAIEGIAARLKAGGRLFYLGAGTSGRLGVLDASECPPTFGVDADLVVGIMAGGDGPAFQKALPLLEQMGKNILLMGPAGCGQHTKAANQIAVAGATAAYTEAILYAEKAGLDPQKMLDAIGGGAAGSWQIANMAPRALAGDFAPGFFVKHFIKDMKIIHDETAGRGVTLEMLESVLALYERFAAAGGENDGTQALIKFYREQSST